jgi:dihydroflavonol-4-reductase
MILVTGGTGLVGSYLLHQLTAQDKPVRALLRHGKRPYRTEHLYSCLPGTKPGQENLVEWVEGDVLDPYSLHDAMKGVDTVYHCAAFISFDPRDRKRMLDVNIGGTAHVVNACLENGVGRLCYVSSIAALGQAENGDLIDENARWKTSSANSGYAVSKYGGEREIWRGMEEGLKGVIVNPSVILGAGCHAKATNRLFHNMKHFLPVYTKGINGYVDVRDVVKAMIMLTESSVSGERYVLNSENLSLYELFSMAADLLGKPRPRLALHPGLLHLIAGMDELRGRITGKRPLLTRENVSAAMAQSWYSSDKIRKDFGFTFIPAKESLAEAFRVLRIANS